MVKTVLNAKAVNSGITLSVKTWSWRFINCCVKMKAIHGHALSVDFSMDCLMRQCQPYTPQIALSHWNKFTSQWLQPP